MDIKVPVGHGRGGNKNTRKIANTMSRKIFVSYKYGDSDVYPLPSGGIFGTTARHYVDEIADILDEHDHIYKGENDNESLEGFQDETIESKLRDKIFDSTVTLVLISKNMKDPVLNEKDQWIPWEISYSLKEITRGDRTSGTNAMVAVVLPDRAGSYEYFVRKTCMNGCTNWQTDALFDILGKNMFNRVEPKISSCSNHAGDRVVHTGNDHSYIHPVKWGDFIVDVNGYLAIATWLQERVYEYNLKKVI